MNKIYGMLLLSIMVGFAVGCGSSTAVNSNSTAATPAQSPAASPSPAAAASPTASGEKVVIKADTPTEAYQTALAATKARDFDSLKKVVSKDVLEFFKFMSEGGESSDELMGEMLGSKDGESGEVRNEKITGNKATLEYKNEKGEWKTLDLVKEDGMWKLTLPEGEKKGAAKKDAAK